jgi:hypothetical protein
MGGVQGYRCEMRTAGFPFIAALAEEHKEQRSTGNPGTGMPVFFRVHDRMNPLQINNTILVPDRISFSLSLRPDLLFTV